MRIANVVLDVLRGAFGRRRQERRATNKLVRQKPIFTANEEEFDRRFNALRQSGARVCAQMSMGVLIDPMAPGDQGEELRRRYEHKIVDWVVLRRDTGEVAALVELDDQTHDAQKDAVRDDLTRDAGYLTARFDSRRRPSGDEIRRAICPT